MGAPNTGAGFPQADRQRNVPLSGMISEDALPDWLRTFDQGQPPPQPMPSQSPYGLVPQQMPSQMPPQSPYGMPAQAPYQMPSQAPRSSSFAPPSQTSQTNPGRMPGMGQMRPGALLDDSVLPDWLRQAGGTGDLAGQPTVQQPAFGQPNGYGAPPAWPSQSPYGNPAPAPYPYGAGGAAQPGQMPSQMPGQMGTMGQMGQMPAASAFPSLDQAGAYQPAPPAQGGMPGSALFDAAALPGWLGGQPGNSAVPNPGQRLGTEGMSAHMLVDEQALPTWLRAQPQDPPPAAMPPTAPRAASPLTSEPMPSWLNQVYSEANVPRLASQQPQSGMGIPSAMSYPSLPSQPFDAAGGRAQLSASAFVDESALPAWLRTQAGMPAPGGAPMAPMPGSPSVPLMGTQAPFVVTPRQPEPPLASPVAGFSAAELIDPSALPDWIQGDQPHQAAPEPRFNSVTGWTQEQPAAPPATGWAAPGAGTGQVPVAGPTTWGSGALPEPATHAWDAAPSNEAGMPAWLQTDGAAGDMAPTTGGYDQFGAPPRDRQQAQARRLNAQRPLDAAELPPWLSAQEPADMQWDEAAGNGQDEYAAFYADEQDPNGYDQGAAEYEPWDADWDVPSPRDERPDDKGGTGWRRIFGRK